MAAKPVVPREQARRDVEAAIDRYLGEDAEAAALGFIDELERAYTPIGRYPATGSPRHAHELNLSGLPDCQVRHWAASGYSQRNTVLTSKRPSLRRA